MRLFAILSFYDESPSWLASCIASLRMIGVDHLIAVDGSYFHFEGEARSPSAQIEAIHLACESVQMGLTLDRPQHKCWTEPQKRTYCFNLLNAIAETFVDWVFVIDADEVITEGSIGIKGELIDTDCDTAIGQLWESFDPDTDVGKNNTKKTMEIYHQIPNETKLRVFQSRFFRVLFNMRVELNHYNYLGEDEKGVTVSLRQDCGEVTGDRPAKMLTPDRVTLIEHRDWWRTAYRKKTKNEYYGLRDELGLEVSNYS